MTTTPPRFNFVLPQLPKPDYLALKKLCKLLGDRVDGPAVTQLEAICTGIRVMCELIKNGERERVEQELINFRSVAPSETPPLL